MEVAEIDAGGVFVLRPTLSAGVLDDGAVLLDLESKFFYIVNASGWAILRLFEAGASKSDVLQCCRNWGATDDVDVESFLERLSAYDALVPATCKGDTGSVSFTGTWSTPSIERPEQPLQQVMVSAFDPSLPLAE